MIELKCTTPDTTKLSKLVPFQGALKKRTDADIQKLADSLRTEGLLMPFAVWEHDDKHYLLDGHGRMSALVQLALHDPDILQQELPCIIVKAETEDDARKALLQIVSMCGHINPKGVIEFSSTVLDYKAPILEKVVRKVEKKERKNASKDVILRVRVASENVAKVKEIFSQVGILEVL